MTGALGALPLGLAIGLLLGALGGGGAVLAVPALVYLLREDVHQATTTSLVVVATASSVGAAIQARHHRVCWATALRFASVAVPGSAAGALLAEHVGSRALLASFAGVLVAVAVMTWRRASAGNDDGRLHRHVPLAGVLAAGFGVGLLTGFFGVGGGFVVVPALVLGLGFAMRRAVGTSLVVVAIVSLAALATHLARRPGVHWSIAVPFALAAAAGALAGSRLGQRVPQRRLAQAFALILGSVATAMFVATA